MQRAMIQYRNPKNNYLVKEALIKAHREDLIGSGPKCLIRAVPPRAGGTTPPPKKLTKPKKPAAPAKGRAVKAAPPKKAAPVRKKRK